MVELSETDDGTIVCRRGVRLGVVRKISNTLWRATYANGDIGDATSKTKAIEKLTRFK